MFAGEEAVLSQVPASATGRLLGREVEEVCLLFVNAVHVSRFKKAAVCGSARLVVRSGDAFIEVAADPLIRARIKLPSVNRGRDVSSMDARLVKQLKGWGFILEEEELIHKLVHASETAGLDAENTVIEFCSFAEKR